LLGGEIIVLVVMANVIFFVLKTSLSFWRENVVISLAKSELINFLAGIITLFFAEIITCYLAGKMSSFP
jgi:hypothetical protein